jgi:L-threonylcarbamoyladenylate synthase
MPREAEAYASRLYRVLHELDGEGLDFIGVEAVPAGSRWDGVRDRIRRAAQKSEATDRMI